MNNYQETARKLIEKVASEEATTSPIIEKTRRQVIASVTAEVGDAWDNYIDAQRVLLAAADSVVAVVEDEGFPDNVVQWMSRATRKLKDTLRGVEKQADFSVSQITDI